LADERDKALDKTVIHWVIITAGIIVGIYLLFLIASPFLVASIQLFNPAPKNRNIALQNGKELLDKTKTVVAVGAHPDDIEWYSGGTLARLSRNGIRVIVVMATDDGRRKNTRQAEQLKAAQALRYEKVIFLGYPDGSLKKQPKQEIINKLEKIYQDYQPDTLITFDPYNQAPFYHHLDHIAAGKAAIEAALQMNIPNIYLFHSGGSDTWVDISKEIGLKVKGREAHKSQTKWFLTPFGMGYIIREAAFLDGLKVGLRYAEPFRKLR